MIWSLEISNWSRDHKHAHSWDGLSSKAILQRASTLNLKSLPLAVSEIF